MIMKPKLKINDIDNLHDARYCSAVGIAYLGFELDPKGNHYIEPAKVKEMMDWLSGPIGVGEFGMDDPSDIQTMIDAAQPGLISLPLNYSFPIPAEWQDKLVFRATIWDAYDMVEVLNRANDFPNAIFDLDCTKTGSDSEASALKILQEHALLKRVFLSYDDPAPIYRWLEKEGSEILGFSLGAFVQEPSGELDYQECDDFLNQFNELVLA